MIHKESHAKCETLSFSPSWLSLRATLSAPSDTSIPGQKKLVLDDLQEKVPEQEWQFFETNVLPPLPSSVTVDNVISRLEEQKAVTRKHGRLVWSEFELGGPKTYRDPPLRKTENEIFKKIQAIATAIKKATGKTHRAERLFRCNPNRTPESESRDNNTRPDGYFLRNPKEGSVDVKNPLWYNVVVPCEFKVEGSEKDKNRNWSQILWSLNHLMREDPTRRFVIGFTIEATELRVWFASRSDVMVSLPVDFTKDVRRVVDFFLRLQFADDCELGIDNTITRLDTLDSTGRVQYDIRVGDKTYRTQRLVSSIGAEAIRGRGTRVWEVRELDSSGKETGPSVILKDFWADVKRQREVTINHKIRDSAAIDEDHARELKGCLLTPLNWWDVEADGRPDTTRSLMLNGKEPNAARTVHVKKDLDATRRVVQTMPPEGTMSDIPTAETEQVVYGEKIHHRAIFEEVGTTIMDAGTLSKAFDYLANVATSLYALHEAGWVHRDISAGNIIIYKDQVKLADIEYAKEESDHVRHDVRTGTVFFMSAEVYYGSYFLVESSNPSGLDPIAEKVPRPVKPKRFKMTGRNARKLGLSSKKQSVDKKKKNTFQHNPLHDMESVLWLGLYIVLCAVLKLERPPDMSEEEWQQYEDARDRLAADLFHDPGMRVTVIMGDEVFLSKLAGLHPRVREICEGLEAARAALTKVYRIVERDPLYLKFKTILSIPVALPSNPQDKMPLHHLFAGVFWQIAKQLSGENDIAFEKRLSFAEQRQKMEALRQAEEERAAADAEKTSKEPTGQRKARRGKAKALELDPEALQRIQTYREKLRKPAGPVSENALI